MDIIAELMANPYQFWLILGGILLLIELLGTAGYSLWSGISAVIVALIALILPISWQTQWIVFSVLTIVVAVAWWKWSQSKADKKVNSIMLNKPYLSLIGKQCTLIEPIVNGFGRAKVADGSWRVKSNTDLPAGTRVTIEAIEGTTLVVKEDKSE